MVRRSWSGWTPIRLAKGPFARGRLWLTYGGEAPDELTLIVA